MKKFIHSIFLSLILITGAIMPLAINQQSAYANDDKNSSDALSVIDGNMDFTFGEDGTVKLSNANSDVSSGFKALLNFTRLLSAVGAIVMLMVFVLNFIKLGTSGTNANARAQAISALVWSGIATACLSMSTVIFFFFFRINKTVVTEKTEEKTE